MSRALVLALAAGLSLAANPSPGSFADGGDTKVSAMMMFLGNNDKVYILDKAEGNGATVNGHPAWGSVWDINSHNVDIMDVKTNVFCASGMHLPNGSFATFGGNGAITKGGAIGSELNPDGVSAANDATYQDPDGSKSIRILNPCTSSDNLQDPKCTWFDDPSVLAMQKKRWYSAAEPLANGTVVMIGGFVNGGYVNRNFPNVDPVLEGGAAEPTYEFFPSNGQPAQQMNFLVKTSGLNSYAHTFLLSSGKMFVQANVSTMIWDYNANQETDLPDMPNNVARVYPASGAVAMLPLTPANNYQQTVLFCGGSDMPADNYGNYSFPQINTWDYPASKDCQRITPEPSDGSQPQYQKDDDMLEGRTMGQFIILPDGKMLVINGGINGTAGYADRTDQTPTGLVDMPFDMSLAAGPVFTPALYDPNAPAGSRWTNKGFSASTIPRLYHSSAILLPDASVLVAGSNPNVDVNLTAHFPTTYKAEIFYPSYFSASTRPSPSGIPDTLSYGGQPFDIQVSANQYSGSSNDAAKNAIIAVLRTGWTTHAMNMGQRFLQLKHTYTVSSNGDITFHVAQMPPNANIFQPGPAQVYVTINSVPSVGKHVIVGSGNIETQPQSDDSSLPQSVNVDSAKGTADGASTSAGGSGSDTSSSGGSKSHTAVIVGSVIGALAVLGLLGAIAGIFVARRRRANQMNAASTAAFARGGDMGGMEPKPSYMRPANPSWSGSEVPLNAAGAYKDEGGRATPGSFYSAGQEGAASFDPYRSPMQGGYR